jgi:hypothetical protein
MKKTAIMILGLCFALFQPGLIAAQDAPSLPLYLMADVQVEVAKVPEYEASFKALIAALGESGFPVVFDTYATDESHYYIIYGLEKGYASVDGLHTAWRDAAAKIGPSRFQALHARMADCELGRIMRFWTFRTDLSFLPSPERLKPAEIGYYVWDYVWLVPGKEAEFEALNREWQSLSSAHKARDPFMTYQGGYGNEEPVYVWFEYGKSAADYALAEENFWRSMGRAGEDLSMRTRAVIRRIDTKTGRYRPDLSYAPRR